jgi:hypothetical protein
MMVEKVVFPIWLKKGRRHARLIRYIDYFNAAVITTFIERRSESQMYRAYKQNLWIDTFSGRKLVFQKTCDAVAI